MRAMKTRPFRNAGFGQHRADLSRYRPRLRDLPPALPLSRMARWAVAAALVAFAIGQWGAALVDALQGVVP